MGIKDLFVVACTLLSTGVTIGLYMQTSKAHEKRLDAVEPKVERHEGDVSFLFGHLDVQRPPK